MMRLPPLRHDARAAWILARNWRALACQLCVRAKARQCSRGISSAARAAVRRSGASAPTFAEPMTSAGPAHRIGRHRHARRQRFEEDDAIGVGAARKDEDIRLGVGPGEALAGERPEEMGCRMRKAKRSEGRTAADDDLASRQVEAGGSRRCSSRPRRGRR